MTELRNIAIIAHVDHGKTTLVDQLLRQSGTFRDNQRVAERVMDSNDQERERGITILAKCASVEWDGIRINIVDTPGHADFGGEVERILSMVDGALVLVDAAEGPMPQTKFVTMKALALGLKPIVVVNKADRPDERAYEVQEEVFDLFAALGATDEQLDFPTLYASAKEGWAAEDLEAPRETLTPLFELITKHFGPPVADAEAPFAMLATILEYDNYLVSPADGEIIKVEEVDGPKELGLENKRFKKISIFMNVFDCHVNRTPCGGKIEEILYKPGKFFNASLDKASEYNERNYFKIRDLNNNEIIVVQIAGLIARRIVCESNREQELKQGDRIGMIRFGSRADVYYENYEPLVKVGQKAISGETLLAKK